MEADKTYSGEIAKVSYTESMKGTVGLRFELALAVSTSAAIWRG